MFAGLLGNILDGVSVVTISVVLLVNLLPLRWAISSLFALLFGGLISNLITVAAEPTNIKFQDALAPIFDKLHPSFWVTNWPICLLGILLPTAWLAISMYKNNTIWKKSEAKDIQVMSMHPASYGLDILLSSLAILFLAEGVIFHAVSENIPAFPSIPLWIVLIPAGITATLHLLATKTMPVAIEHMKTQWPVWNHLTIIFCLLWFLMHGLMAEKNILELFYILPGFVQYNLLLVLSLLSSVTDNVALAAMQGAIITAHPIAIWQIRLLLILLTWSGGFTPFGCLQSLSINARLKLSTNLWLRETPIWAGLAIVGGLAGLLLIPLL